MSSSITVFKSKDLKELDDASLSTKLEVASKQYWEVRANPVKYQKNGQAKIAQKNVARVKQCITERIRLAAIEKYSELPVMKRPKKFRPVMTRKERVNINKVRDSPWVSKKSLRRQRSFPKRRFILTE
eukprot:GHVH01010988.1.p2 GENE.GHVH01010988.1~~GHVH01010988.1.p2  ORF type:complete len:128 (+),score=21.58 GHVH01010988.1:131-514(+)